ncbi:hypothetical protein FHX44_117805 [Pseudonocardia hierapolitana]|uniref:Uncharacterized protein n=1 Tax=Pseudonocardia hierapolitana TaxID=1128676 RepID=A0A561T415_9PSEU|nr:hypothetical protein FHX44_117805 [Pseudonocardia hierapolitana]
MPRDKLTPIAVAQNSEYSTRLLAAQARLYTDAKNVHDVRVTIVLILSTVTIIAALMLPAIRPLIGATGGIAALLWSAVASDRERRRRREAAFVQEEFDTHVFNLPWNDLAADHPSPTLIAEAAARYRGNRTQDWYPDTKNVVRPLDVLICQRSNLGWGSSMHRYYAACLTGALLLLVVGAAAVSLVFHMSVVDMLTAVLVPLLAPLRELIEMIKANRDSGETKAKLEAKVLSLWSQGMRGPNLPTVSDCRAVQDRILGIRQSNAHVPDWLDSLRRNRTESIMQQSAAHLISEAIQHGRVR